MKGTNNEGVPCINSWKVQLSTSILAIRSIRSNVIKFLGLPINTHPNPREVIPNKTGVSEFLGLWKGFSVQSYKSTQI